MAHHRAGMPTKALIYKHVTADTDGTALIEAFLKEPGIIITSTIYHQAIDRFTLSKTGVDVDLSKISS